MSLSASIELVSSSARVTSVKSTQGVSRSDGQPDPKIGPQVYLVPIKKTRNYIKSKNAINVDLQLLVQDFSGDIYENTQRRKIKQIQPIRSIRQCILVCRQFGDTFENTQ